MPLRVLIFGTCYVATPDRKKLLQQWADLHETLNPGCDLLLVDSDSPKECVTGFWSWGNGGKEWRKFFSFPDNIGHLSHAGRDGWGRAFCHGLQHAIDHGYDYAVHIEGDSLFRLKVVPICERLRSNRISVAGTRVAGTTREETDWLETGLMFFDVNWLKDAQFIAQYDWENGAAKRYPQTPEWHIFNIVRSHLTLMPWRAARGDTGQITVDNVSGYDWVTHCPPDVYDRFVAGCV